MSEPAISGAEVVNVWTQPTYRGALPHCTVERSTMQHSGYAPGETTLSRLKMLWLTLRELRGEAEANAFLAAIEVQQSDLDDETRPLALDLLHSALVVFAERYGRDLVLQTWRGAIHSDNAAVWMRVVRGTQGPAAAFRQIQGLGREGQRTTEWETLDEGPGHWHGRVVVRHDPALEKDGLLNLARCAELAAIPVFYGLPPARVEIVTSARGTFASRTGATGTELRAFFEPASDRANVIVPATALAFLGGLGFFASLVVGVLGVVLGTAVGVGFGVAIARERARRREQTAVGMRLRASERSTELREQAPSTRASGEGTVIAGLYRLGAPLGAGATGIIHRATRLSDHGPVAVKILRAAVAHDPIASDRLGREAEAMRLAWHPNVVELLDQGALPDGTGYIVMELLEGEALSARLARESAIPSEELRAIVLQLCDALGAIHAAGVVHRDLKPGNLVLVKAGTRARLKIIDFGIARVEWAETKLTNTDTPLGTPGYMSPEQREARDAIDGRSDLYAVGALLHECLTGVLPPSAEVSSASLERPSGVRRAHPAVPEEWAPIVARLLQRDPDDRYRDARALRDAIDRAFSSQAGEARG